MAEWTCSWTQAQTVRRKAADELVLTRPVKSSYSLTSSRLRFTFRTSAQLAILWHCEDEDEDEEATYLDAEKRKQSNEDPRCHLTEPF